jgi:predicted permease
VNLRVVGLGVAVIAATTVFFGLVPALVLLKRQIATDLKTGERGSSSRGARRIYSALVGGEVALACVLLVSSALLVRTVSRMMSTPTGVDADQVLTTTVRVSPVSYGYRTWRSVSDTHAAIIEHMRLQPGVEAVGATNFLPFDVGWRLPFGIVGQPPPARTEDAPIAQFHSVSEGYFESLRVPIAQGRVFSNVDTVDAAPVVVVNETFAKRFLMDRAPLGQSLSTTVTFVGPLGANLFRLPPPVPGAPPPVPGRPLPLLPPRNFEIVGVVQDVRNAPFGQAVEPAVYFTTRQFPFTELFLTVRAADTAAGLSAIQAALKAVAPTIPHGRVETWGDRFARRTAEPRLLMTVLVFFGGLAAVLAAIGVYGLMAWSLALRTRELAIRITLGAPPARVGWLVVRQSALLMVAGLAVGLLLVRVGQRALATVLFGVSPTDLGSTAAASALLVGAALAACIAPAWQAMRVDPVEGLRVE